MLLPGLVKADSFQYNRLITSVEGSDNFSMDKNSEARVAGTIEVATDRIAIDGASYELKPMKKENCFKSKNSIFRLVYSGSKLLYVQHFSRGKVYSYRIQHQAQPATGRNAG